MDSNTIIIISVIIGGFFFGMIIFLILKMLKRTKEINAEENIKLDKSEWKYFKNINEITDIDFNNYLHKINDSHKDYEKFIFKSITHGKYKDMDFIYTVLSSMVHTTRKKHNPHSFITHLFVIKSEKSKIDLMLTAKQSGLSKMLQPVGSNAVVPVEENIDWMYVSDLDTFKKLNINYNDRYKLKEILSKNLYSIHFFDGYIACYVEWNTLHSIDKIFNRLQDIYLLRTLLN